MKHAIAIFVSAAVFTGCASAPQSLASKQSSVLDRSEQALKALPGASLPVTESTPGSSSHADTIAKAKRPVARYASKAWHGARMSDVQDDTVLPPIFSEPFKLKYDDRASQGRVTLAVVGERIARLAGVPVRIKSDVYQSNNLLVGAPLPSVAARPAVPMASPLPIPTGAPSGTGRDDGTAQPSNLGLFQQPVTTTSSIEMSWDGTLTGFLDDVTSRLGVSWAYRDGAVVIERFVTESFELSAFGGTQDYKMALTGGNSGTSGSGGTTGSASSTLDLAESGKMAALDSLRQAIEGVLGKSGGSVILNEGTGRFFVTATKDVIARVRDIVKAEDAALQRQAHIQFDIYSVISDSSDEKGVDWSVVYQGLTNSLGATLKSPTTLTGSSTAGIGISILAGGTGTSSGRLGGSSAVLNLLNQVGSSAMYRPVSMIAMNRQWARKTNLKVDGYVSETSPSTASSAGSGAPGLKTSSITTGDKFMVQPAILDNGSIILKFGVSLTELLGLFDVTAGSGNTLQKVQTPVTSGTDDQGTIRLLPGEAMVVTGLSRRLSSQDRRTLSDGMPVALGGSRKDSFKREEFLIVVRASQI
jgi:type IVB pilus formation R64 PilN family outer membrane protein